MKQYNESDFEPMGTEPMLGDKIVCVREHEDGVLCAVRGNNGKPSTVTLIDTDVAETEEDNRCFLLTLFRNSNSLKLQHRIFKRESDMIDVWKKQDLAEAKRRKLLATKREQHDTTKAEVKMADKLDLAHVANDFIITYTGRKFSYANPTPDMINVLDLAHHLSHHARFAGALFLPYRVGQHVVRAANQPVRGSGSPEASKHDILRRLIHDGAEAYMGDMPAPLKKLLTPEEYNKVEGQINDVIAEYFGDLGYLYDETVREADLQCLADESSALANCDPATISIFSTKKHYIENARPFDCVPQRWFEIKKAFLQNFANLMGFWSTDGLTLPAKYENGLERVKPDLSNVTAGDILFDCYQLLDCAVVNVSHKLDQSNASALNPKLHHGMDLVYIDNPTHRATVYAPFKPLYRIGHSPQAAKWIVEGKVG